MKKHVISFKDLKFWWGNISKNVLPAECMNFLLTSRLYLSFADQRSPPQFF